MLIGSRIAAWQRGKKLPYDAEVEYLQGDTVSYIDLGFKAQSGMYISVRYSKIINTGNTGYIFIGNDTWKKNAIGVMDAAYGYRFVYASGVYDGLRDRTTGVHEIVFDDNKAYFDNVLQNTFSQTSFSSQNNMFLFGNTSTKWNGKIYEVKWRVGSDYHELIPVRKNGVRCMYDRVSDELLGNVGTGAFIIGPDKVSNGGGLGYKCIRRFSSRSTRRLRSFRAMRSRNLWKEVA